MARNSEKAQAMLNRWTTMKSQMRTGSFEPRRPRKASDVTTVGAGERWRADIMKEITKKVAEIQNAGLGEHRLRDLNDEINKLLRIKKHWEDRIVELGGSDHRDKAPTMYDGDGRPLAGTGGYKYFGAAKNLPGVQELFQPEEPKALKRTRYDMYQGIDPDYYGYRDEDDGILLVAEAEVEAKAIAAEVERFDRVKRQREESAQDVTGKNVMTEVLDEKEAEGLAATEALMQSIDSAQDNAAYRAHVPVPDQADIEKLVMARKKKELLEKYATEEYLTAQLEARQLMAENSAL